MVKKDRFGGEATTCNMELACLFVLVEEMMKYRWLRVLGKILSPIVNVKLLRQVQIQASGQAPPNSHIFVIVNLFNELSLI